MSESRLIGRSAPLDDIQQHIYHCLSGQPRVLLIDGLAGIGKTRFLEEVAAVASHQGMDVYAGWCDETMTEPYAPFAGLLPRLEAEDMLERRQVTLARRLFGAAVQTHPVPTLDEAQHDHIEFLMAVSHTLIRRAKAQPLMVIVDNLHAADQPSLDLFDYLAFTLAEQRTAPVLLVGSHRPAPPDTAVGRLLSQLRREQIVHSMELDGLNEQATRDLLKSLGVTRPTQQLIHTIHEATHGIPLFIQEAVHHAHRSGALYTRGGYLAVRQSVVAALQLPRDISDAIAGRIDVLSPGCRDALTSASLLGDSFPADRLVIFEQGSERTEVAMIEAVDRGLLRREGAQYHFTHSLVRQTLSIRLDREQRQCLHRRIAQGLQHLYADNLAPHLLEIAHHLLEADSLVEAETLRSCAERAGDQAFSRFAWREAARYYEAALSATETDAERAVLHQQAGLSHYRNQDAGPALEHFEQARASFEALGDAQGLAQSLVWLVRIRLTHASVPMGVLAPYVEDLEAVLDTSDIRLRGHIMAVLAQAYRHARQPEKGARLAQAALAIGRQVKDDRLCALAGESLGLTRLSSFQVEPAIASWQESLKCARSAGDLVLQSLALTNLPLVLNLQGHLEEGEIAAREGSELTRTLQDWSQYSKALSHQTSIAVARGNFRDADQYAHDTMLMVERSRYPWGGFRALGALAQASAARGLWDEANHALDTLCQPGQVFATPGRIIQVFAKVFRQLILGYQDRMFTEYIGPLYDELMEVVAYDTYSLAPLCAMVELGELCLMPSFTERPAEMLQRAMDQGVMFSSGWCFLIPRVLGIAARMQDDWDQARAHFEHAISVATYSGAAPELARTYLDYGHTIGLNAETEDYTPVREFLEQAQWIFFERHMIPHAHLTSRHLETWFPQEYFDDDDAHQNGEEPFPGNGTTRP